MTRAASFNYKTIKKILLKLGCTIVGRPGAGGSHEIRYSPFTCEEFTVVDHKSKATPKGTFVHMLKCGGIDKDLFFKTADTI